MPVLALAGALVLWGLIYLGGVGAVLGTGASASKRSLAVVLGFGLAARLVLMTSEPILEADYHRYLWDGAVASAGFNPYLTSPEAIRTGAADVALLKLRIEAGPVFDRINHKDLTTIYPPVTQAAFALAHAIAPYSLAAWRTLLLAGDIAALAMLLLCLQALGRSPLWSALYWWNPVLLKETYNSAHFDVLLLPFLLAALLLVHKRRPLLSAAMLGLAAGVKLWPVLLLPLILRPFVSLPHALAGAALNFAAMMALWLAPLVLAGLGENAGLAAYATSWNKNGPLFSLLQTGLSASGFLAADTANLVARAVCAAAILSAAIWVAWRPLADFADLIGRALIVIATLVLFSPAVYPWYTLWFLPLLAMRPEPALLALTATIPLYYTYFYFADREMTATFHGGIVWLIWLPVLALLAWRVRWFPQAGEAGHARG